MSDPFRYPDFFIIGAYKSGSTSLHYYLGQHPEIFMASQKGANYLAFRDQPPSEGRQFGRKPMDFEAYRAMFAGSDRFRMVGECSPHYLASTTACRSIRAHRPDARLIAVLRNPVEAIYSRYLMQRRDAKKSFQLSDLIDAEIEREETGWGVEQLHLWTARYATLLQPYLETFPPEQILIRLFDDLVRDGARTLSTLFTFLGVDPTFTPRDQSHYNRSGIPRGAASRAVHQNRRWLRPLARVLLPPGIRGALRNRLYDRLERPALGARERDRLTSYYREDVLMLQEIIGRDLRHWLT